MHPTTPATALPACRGDVRTVLPAAAGGQAQLCLVLAAGDVTGAVEVALLHTSPDLATAADCIVPGEEAGTTYPVVVQSDLRGLVAAAQLGSRTGRITPEVLAAANALLGGGPAAHGLRRGTRLPGPHDRRWSHKAQQGAALDLLTGDPWRWVAAAGA